MAAMDYNTPTRRQFALTGPVFSFRPHRAINLY